MMSFKTTIEELELEEIEIDGERFGTEEAVMYYEEASPRYKAEIDKVTQDNGVNAAVRLIYSTYFDYL